MPITFKAWLREQQFRDDCIGDLARDAMADESLPDDHRAIVSHMMNSACPAAMDAIGSAVTKWRQFNSQRPIR